MQFDVVVAGGGIIGASCAYELSKKGLKVALLDPRPFGQGASGNSAAMIEFQLDAHRGEPFFSLAKSSAALFPALHQEVKNLTGIDFQYERCGILQLALNAAEASELKKEAVWQKEQGLKVSWLFPNELAERFPLMAPQEFGGIVYEDDGQVNGEKFLSAMIAAARKAGAQTRDNLGKISLLLKSGNVVGLQASDGTYEAATVVVAAGAWTDQLLEPLKVKTGVEPIRGQLVVYDTPKQEFPIPVYTKSGGYITPKRDGYTLAGTTVEKVGFDSSTTSEGKSLIERLAKMLFPHLEKTKVRGMTAGLRPKSPGEMPIIGPLQNHKNVIVAAGHYRNGILLAPITATMVAQMVTNE